jgi:hypothetical protein
LPPFGLLFDASIVQFWMATKLSVESMPTRRINGLNSEKKMEKINMN